MYKSEISETKLYKGSGVTTWHLRSKRSFLFVVVIFFPGGGFHTARKGVSGWWGA